MLMQPQKGGRGMSNLLNADIRRGRLVNAMARALHPHQIAPVRIVEARWAPGPFSS